MNEESSRGTMIRGPRKIGMIAVLSIVGVIGIFLIDTMDGARTVTRDGVAMNTVVSVTLVSAKPKPQLNAILDEIFALIGELDKKFSMWNEDSPLSEINRNAGISPSAADGDLYSVLETARRVAMLTDGAYDPTIGSVTRIWRDGTGEGRLPSSEDIASALPLVGCEGLKLTSGGEAYLERRGANIDLGGIAKGYALWSIRRLLREKGVGSALVNMGGDILAVGDGDGDRPWRIGIQSPSKDRGTPLCAVRAANTSIVTAGVYERRWEMEGREWTHIYDPSTGFPIEGDLLSATVISADPAEGDALSTAFMVIGPARSLDLLRILPGVDAIFVLDSDERGMEVLATPGVRDSLEMFDDEYRLTFVDVY
ncbi:MAG: FAD:protein FMN transferase [Synergistaceae bacterium]|jgi:thiamine biosynthesis lipoprotein|nr:FAD:protein FMN transferase [Synergistaceae bacterium]